MPSLRETKDNAECYPQVNTGDVQNPSLTASLVWGRSWARQGNPYGSQSLQWCFPMSSTAIAPCPITLCPVEGWGSLYEERGVKNALAFDGVGGN